MNTVAAPKEYKLSKFSTYYIFALLFLLYFFDYVDRMIVTSLFPYIQKEWGLTDTQSGLLVSVVYWSIVAFVFPVSILVDRWSRKKTIAIMALDVELGHCAMRFHQELSPVAHGPLRHRYRGSRVCARRHGNALRPLSSGKTLPHDGSLEHVYPPRDCRWDRRRRICCPALGMAACLWSGGSSRRVCCYSLLLCQRLQNSGSGQDRGILRCRGAQKARMSKMDIFREFIHTPSLMLTNLGFIGCIFVNNAIIVWLPTYLHRVEGISMSEAGTKVGAIMLLAIIGLPVGGWLTDVWFKKNVSSRMLFPSLTIALNTVVIFAAFFFLDGKAQYLMLLLMGVLASMFAPAAIIVTQEVIHPGLRAISYSVCVVFQNLFGASMAPIVIGALSDAYGIKVAMSILPVFLLASAVLFFAGSFSYKKDLDKVEKVALECED